MHYKLSSRFPYVKKQRNYDLGNSIGDELAQRIIIPQGLVNPSQTTIIEIPYNFQDIPTVIAKPKEDPSVNKFYPVNNSTTRQTKIFPQASDASARTATSSQYSTGSASSRTPTKTRTVIETTRFTEEIPFDDDSTYNDLDEKAKDFLKRDQLPVPILQENNAVYEKLGREFLPKRLEKNCKPQKRNLTPINDVLQGGEHNYLDTGRCSVVYDPNMQAEPFKKQIPHYNIKLPSYSAPKDYMEPPESNLNTMNYFTENKSSIPTYANYQKKHFPFENKNEPEEELKDVLDNLDLIEAARIRRELKQFQKARRKSIYEAASIKH
ncbi:hypothetical protein ILUMI_26158 [Ignelater luminosus]|uniref:Uncharacterized protein n=1 Tax=Ignelater luminosus TaxID=2038154 RepID=A0A8K0C726_IGNLU|nr:hypothetical protein ILUMI_26158 [Ignelater luminosus]